MFKHIKYLVLIFILCNCVLVLKASAATINAASCSKAHVEAAISSASNGDTINIPSGIETWTGYVDVAKELKLVGAGIDSTIIRGYGFRIVPSTDNIEITGFTFDGDVSGPKKHAIYCGVKIYQNCGDNDGGTKRFRFHHNKFMEYLPTNWDSWWFCNAINLKGFCYGVIDNNQFVDCLAETIYYAADNDEGWGRAEGLGGYENGTVFVEDNTFTSTGSFKHYYLNVIDANCGARYVFRYNTVEDHVDAGIITVCECHGACNNDTDNCEVRGTHSVEIYNNTIIKHSAQDPEIFKIRGGRGYIYGNRLYAEDNCFWGLSYQIHLTEYRASPKTYSACYDCTSSGCSGPALNTYCPNNEGYPCKDQINKLYFYDNKKDVNQVAGAETWVDLACFVNTNGEIPNYIVEGRDFFWNTQYPSYTAYAYPHPLRTKLGEDGPTAPTGLQVIK